MNAQLLALPSIVLISFGAARAQDNSRHGSKRFTGLCFFMVSRQQTTAGDTDTKET
jgi:hypothetical protein